MVKTTGVEKTEAVAKAAVARMDQMEEVGKAVAV